MGENYLKLLEELKTVPEIKKDLEENNEVEKSYINDLIDNTMYLYNRITEVEDYNDTLELQKYKNNIIEFLEEKQNTFIEERHIRMYCLNKTIVYECLEQSIRLRTYGDFSDKYKIEIKIDNSKPFYQQDEEVYKQILDYFNSIKN